MVSDVEKSEDISTEQPEKRTSANTEAAKDAQHSTVVASHYNKIEERGIFERTKSNIFFMRNFNNWIKSVVIDKYASLVKNKIRTGSPFRVLDLCCGKGGDLMKWDNLRVTHLICTDIAEVSLEQCESRYKHMFGSKEGSRSAFVRKVEFFAADATLQQLRTKYEDPSMKLNLVSCQFAFHYSFETFKQADCMLKNAAECLEEGFYFIGTIPDANEIMKRQRTAMSDSFGNAIYNIKFLCDTEKPPLFGAKYNFRLDDVVDCPEFLVHFPTLEKLALRHGLQLVEKKRFEEVFEEWKKGKHFLLERMQALETYNSQDVRQQDEQVKPLDQYQHVECGGQHYRVGTLSKNEWEAATLYLFFAFRKMKTNYDKKGRPVYSD
ncbi:mRNA cap guanine-N7 methyltransferase [Anopheles bellator]|uniref:mRNA cap guanine-N7 methyltransferase n=1 Tax=Anopheles bellator TaxID=139047 RepID=UPI0026499B81|nr:mRNA cap guanine-N7 methyltransferase [Anopheles bellator]